MEALRKNHKRIFKLRLAKRILILILFVLIFNFYELYKKKGVVFVLKIVKICFATYYPGSCQKCFSSFSRVEYLVSCVTLF
jgi:hypothetical protein